MRYWHTQFDDIAAHIVANRLEVVFCDLWGKEGRSSSLDELKEFFLRSKTYPKDDATEYAIVSASSLEQPMPFKQAVQAIEAGGSDTFLLQEYPDGGVISFSSHQLPFQLKAKPADWWEIEDVELTTRTKNPWQFFPKGWWLPRSWRS